jgi:hypothetical protein
MKSFSVTPCPVDLSDALLRQGVTEIDKYILKIIICFVRMKRPY